MESFWNQVYWGNTVRALVIAAAALIVATLLIRVIKNIVVGRMQKLAGKTESRFDDVLAVMVKKFVVPYVSIFVYYSIIQQLTLHPKLDLVLDGAMSFVTMFFAVRLINHLMQITLTLNMRRRGESEERIRQLSGMLVVVKALVWVIGLLTLAHNYGFDVTTLLASLGVGGIAIALASQAVLGDLFSYLVIFFDKPFEIGDFVILNDGNLGTVEYVGIKTTRIRSLWGEQLIISNTQMTSNTIKNYKRMERRRVVFKIAVVYRTPYAKLQQIPEMLKAIVGSRERVMFDRAHLQEYGTYSINFEIVYYVLSPDYNVYMDIQQDILFRIHEEFSKNGIEFAIPSQTLWVAGTPKELAQRNGENKAAEEKAATNR